MYPNNHAKKERAWGKRPGSPIWPPIQPNHAEYTPNTESVGKMVRGAEMVSDQPRRRETEDSRQQHHRLPYNLVLQLPSKKLRQITLDNRWEPTVEATPPNDNGNKNKDDNHKKQKTPAKGTSTMQKGKTIHPSRANSKKG